MPRIVTFGYNADVAFGQPTAEIVDYAKSLLVSLEDKREESEVREYGEGEVLEWSPARITIKQCWSQG